MKKNYRYLFSLMLIALSIFLTACQSNNENSVTEENEVANQTEKKVLEFWSFWGSGSRNEVVKQLVDEYNQQQDNVEIKYVYQPWGDIWTKALAATAAGNPPDIIVQDINSVAHRANAEQSTNITEFVKEGTEDQFYPQLWETVKFEDGIYGLPFNTDTQVIFYNKRHFKEAGITEEQLPKTWEELETVAHQLDIEEGGKYQRIGFYPLWNLGMDVWALNGDEGTSWFNKDEEVTINTPGKLDAFEWVKKWQDYYGVDTINKWQADFGDGMSDPFISGKLSMRANNINYYVNLEANAPADFEFGIIELPAKTADDEHWTWGGGFVLEIPKGAKNVPDAYVFIEYMTSQASQEKFGAHSFDIMANKKANETLKTNQDLTDNGRLVYEIVNQNFEKTVITPVPITAPDYNNLVKGEIDKVMIEGKNPEEALEAAQKSVENLVDQHR